MVDRAHFLALVLLASVSTLGAYVSAHRMPAPSDDVVPSAARHSFQRAGVALGGPLRPIDAGRLLEGPPEAHEAAYRRATGRPLPAAPPHAVTDPVLTDGGFVVVGTTDERLLVLDADATVVCSLRARADFVARPVVSERGLLYAATRDGQVFGIDPQAGVQFHVDVGAGVVGPLALDSEGVLWFGTLGPRPRVIGMRSSDGHVLQVFAAPFSDDEAGGFDAGVRVGARLHAPRRGALEVFDRSLGLVATVRGRGGLPIAERGGRPVYAP